ncbi:MAG: metal-dependent hydrolase [Candidatus Diapherotrites archaeon]
MFTLFHGLIPYFTASALTKDKRIWLITFIAGMLPDLDGLPIFFDMNLYYQIHHELFHAPIYGLILGILIALILGKYFKLNKLNSFLAFAGGFALHGLTDVLFTYWPVKLLWPLSNEQFSFPIFSELIIPFSAILAVMLLIQIYFIAKKNQTQKAKKQGYEKK